jgi:hypothetical protein
MSNIWARPARRRGARADRCRAGRGRDGQPRGSGQDPPPDQRRERTQRRDRHPVRAGRDRGAGDSRACRQRRGPGRRGSCLTLRLPAAQHRDLSRDASRHSHAPALRALARPAAPATRQPYRGCAGHPGIRGPLRRSSRWPRLRMRPPPTPLPDGPGRCRRRAPARRDRRAILSGAGDTAGRVPEAMEVHRARIHRGAS